MTTPPKPAHTASVQELREELEILGAQTNRDGISFHARMGLLSSALDELERLRKHFDAAGPEHNLLALLDLYNDRTTAAETQRDALRGLAEETTRHAADGDRADLCECRTYADCLIALNKLARAALAGTEGK